MVSYFGNFGRINVGSINSIESHTQICGTEPQLLGAIALSDCCSCSPEIKDENSQQLGGSAFCIDEKITYYDGMYQFGTLVSEVIGELDLSARN